MRSPQYPARRKAAEHLLDYLQARSGRLTVVYEDAYEEIIAELTLAARRHRTDIDTFRVETLAPEDVSRVLNGAQKFLCAFNRQYAVGLDDRVLRMIQHATERASCAFTLSDISDAFWEVFQIAPGEICSINQRLDAALSGRGVLRVRDPRGTDLRIPLGVNFDVVHIDGFQDAALDLTVNLPPGEVATYSDDVSGTIWFCGALLGTVPIGRKYGLITDPVGFEVRRNRVVEVHCRDAGLRADLLFCLDLSPFTRNVCEIGFGTHPGVRQLIGLNYTYEEKHYGFHLGLGATLAQQNVTRETDHHLDLLFSDCVVELDGRLLFDGEYRV